MAVDIIIEEGKCVLGNVVKKSSIAINNGKIVSIGNKHNLPQADKKINAKNKIVIPGGIDTHSHYETSFMGETVEEDWEEGTRAAAIGGTTTTIDFAVEGEHGEDPISAIENQLTKAKEFSNIDFGLHACFTDFSDFEKIKRDMKDIFSKGIPSFKEYMIYTQEELYIDDWDLLKIMKEVKKDDGIVGLHAENAEIGESWQQELVEEGKTDYKYHGVAKPNFVEAEAIQRALSISEFVGAKTYIVHMSTKEGVKLVKDAKRRGLQAWSETCPHYLTITDDIYDTDLALYSMCSPPLRKEEDIEKLWQGLADGTISIVGSDHVAFTKEQKEAHSDKFVDVPNGTPQSEVRVPIVFAEGVKKDRLSLLKFAEVVSTNAAKMFGMYPQKGIIAPGSDADIVIIDPDKKKSLNHENLHMGPDWSLYKGMEIEGWPIMTIHDGKVIVEDEEFVGEKGRGQFVEGNINENWLNSV